MHAHVVFHALQRAWRGDPNQLPHGYADLLDLMAELAASLETGVDDPQCRAFLESLRGSSKPAKAARALLAFPQSSDYHNALGQAIELRQARIDRWAQRC